MIQVGEKGRKKERGSPHVLIGPDHSRSGRFGNAGRATPLQFREITILSGTLLAIDGRLCIHNDLQILISTIHGDEALNLKFK